MIYLGLTREVVNPISRKAKLGSTMIQRSFEVGGHGNNTAGFTDIGDTPTENGLSKP